MTALRALPRYTAAAVLLLCTTAALAQLPTLDDLPTPRTPPPERGPVVPAQVERWRLEAKAYEYGEGLERDAVRAAELYCRAARHGDAEAQYSLAWMLTNSRGINRDEAQAAHLFAAAAEQGMVQAQNMLARMGTPQGPPPACLRPPEGDVLAAPPPVQAAAAVRPVVQLPPPPPPPNAPEPIVRFVNLLAPDYGLQPHLVLAIMATESNFDPNAVSPKDAHGLMQLIPGTAARFGVRNIRDAAQNIRGGMAYLRWLLAYYRGNVALAVAGYNAGEGAVDRYRGVPPYKETQAYVRRILEFFPRTEHPFDARLVNASPALSAIKAVN